MSPTILSIAGTDPSGGAGIQADLKAFSALGGYGTTVITALVAQTTTGVSEVHDVPPEFVRSQLDTLLTDVRVDAVKIGMLSSTEIIEVVAAAFDAYLRPNWVLYPVLVAKSGDRSSPLTRWKPCAPCCCRGPTHHPNLPEAADLLGEEEATDLTACATRRSGCSPWDRAACSSRAATCRSYQHGPAAVGGRRRGDPDRGPGEHHQHARDRVHAPRNRHAAPAASHLAQAVRDAKDYLTEALRHADKLDIGKGKGPVHHFHAWWGN